MKSSVYAILMAFVLAIGLGGFSAVAEAKKLGGGGSFGKSYSVPKQNAAPASTTNTASAAAGGAASKGGLMGGLAGGLLGGLLMGGLFAALMGGAFDGLAFGDILLFALIGFLVYKFFIAPRRRAAAMAGGAQAEFRQMPAQAPTASSYVNHSATVDTAPEMQLPPGFNAQAFVAGAKEHYITLQKAWDDNDLSTIEEYVSPELFEALSAERAKLGDNKAKTEVVSLMVDLVRGEFIGSTASITLKFNGWIKEGEQTSESTEFWHLEKSMKQDNATWLIVGIQQDN